MRKKSAILSSGLTERRKRLQAFAEVLCIALAIQAIANFIFQQAGMDIRLAAYEVALIWMFCV
jgi:hypothetical protein